MKKSYDNKFKSRVALEALRGDLTLAEIDGKRRIHSALRYQTPDEVYFAACNLHEKGYGKSKVFTPIFQ